VRTESTLRNTQPISLRLESHQQRQKIIEPAIHLSCRETPDHQSKRCFANTQQAEAAHALIATNATFDRKRRDSWA
jgi:hypothetical protein